MSKKVKTVEEMLAEKRAKKILVDKLMPKVPSLPQPKVSIFNRTWAFLSGKKRAIGIVSFTVGELTGGTVGLVFKAVGAIFGFTGVADPVAKNLNKRTSGETIQWRELLNQIWQFILTLFKKGG